MTSFGNWLKFGLVSHFRLGLACPMVKQDDIDHSRNLSVSEEAVEWFAKLNSGDCSEAEQRRFEAWLSTSEVHGREYGQVQSLWKELDGLKKASRDFTEQISLSDKAFLSTRPTPSSRLPYGTAWAALILLAVGLLPWWQGRDDTYAAAYRTAKGEIRTLSLPDGSIVEMNTETALSVEISAQTRRIILENGEALFTVAHEEARPFEVVTGEGVIRDLGTQFNVYRETGIISVAVLDGTVEITGGEENVFHSRPIKLSRGAAVSFLSGEGFSPVRQIRADEAAAWHKGRLVFDGTPLPEVIRQINRYHSKKVLISDHDLDHLKVSGSYDIKNQDRLLLDLQEILPIVAEQKGNEVLLASRRMDAPPASPPRLLSR